MSLSSTLHPGAFDGLDILGIVAALAAAVLAVQCALRPHYHSSRTRRKHDTRLWTLVCIIMTLVALYQLLGAQILVHRFVPSFLQTIADHGGVVQQAFFVASAVAVLVVLFALYGWLAGSIRRNVPALFGATIALASLGLGLFTQYADARRAAMGDPKIAGDSLQVAGIVVGAMVIAYAAIVYRRQQLSQRLWRHQLKAGPNNRTNANSARRPNRRSLRGSPP